MTEHWCLVELDCLLDVMQSFQICFFDVSAASGGNNIKKNRRKGEEGEEEGDLRAR
jgi:hypothetical protein